MRLVVGLCLATLLFACNQSKKEDGIAIVGELVTFPNGGEVYIEQITETGNKVVDTVEVTDLKFATSVVVEEPSFYQINFGGKQRNTFILSGDESEILIKADGNNPQGSFEIEGSKASDFKEKMDVLMSDYQREIRSLQSLQREARNENQVEEFQNISSQMQELSLNTQDVLKGMIKESVPTLAAFYGLQMIQLEENFEFFSTIATDLETVMPTNYLVKDLVNNLKLSQSLAIGSEAPEISLPNPNGELITLTSLRGKYVLIDFWAAWCRPCRMENPNVVKVYNEYSAQNFEILGVSLDKTRDAWLTAIEQDGLPWLHISDLKFWRSEAAKTYQIKAIPATYLIDPEGKIIAKNLRGATLEAKLKEIFG